LKSNRVIIEEKKLQRSK